jgi:hypothetical protein
MATVTERLELLITGDARDAVAALRQAGGAATTLDDGVTGTTTKMSKLGAMAGVAGDHIRQNIGMYSVAAVGALSAAAVASIREFTDLAGKVRDFSRASGLGAEQSSRLVAVFDDLQISQEKANTGFFRFARGLESGSVDLSKYGAEVVRSKDGNLDMYRTLLSVADAFESTTDQGTRAQLVQEAFGRGGLDLIPILEQGRDGIREMFNAVPDRQILSDEQVMSARRFELAMDDLNDSMMELKVAAGNELVPTLTTLASAMATAIRFTGDLSTKLEDLEFAGTNAADVFDFVRNNVEGTVNPLKGVTNALQQLGVGGDNVDRLAEAQGRYNEALAKVTELSDAGVKKGQDLRAAKDELATAEDKVLRITERRTAAQQTAIDKDREAFQVTYDLMLQKLGLEGAEISLERAVLRYNQVNAESTATDLDKKEALLGATNATLNYAKQQVELEGLTTDSEAGQRRMAEILNYVAGTLDPNNPLVKNLQTYADKLGGIPEEVRTRFAIELNTEEINRQIASLGLSADEARQIFGEGFLAYGATGGIVNRPTVALIGEAGPEAVIPLSRVPGNQPLPAMGFGGGGSITIPLVVDGRVLAEVTASELNRPGGPLIRQRAVV